jgi:hypothetical protein
MSKFPKQPRQRDDLKRWEDEGGAPRSGHPSRELPVAPEGKAQPDPYYFSVRTPGGVIEDPEWSTYASLQSAREDSVSKACDMIAEGDQKGEDRRSWHIEIMGRANQQVLAVALSEVLGPEAADQAAAKRTAAAWLRRKEANQS